MKIYYLHAENFSGRLVFFDCLFNWLIFGKKPKVVFNEPLFSGSLDILGSRFDLFVFALRHLIFGKTDLCIKNGALDTKGRKKGQRVYAFNDEYIIQKRD